MFDTAQIYGTEAAVAGAIRESNIPRSDVTIVTKLHPQNHGYEWTISSVEVSLKNLQTDYIDVFLIHAKECNAGYFKCPEGIVRELHMIQYHIHTTNTQQRTNQPPDYKQTSVQMQI